MSRTAIIIFGVVVSVFIDRLMGFSISERLGLAQAFVHDGIHILIGAAVVWESKDK